MEKKVGAVVWQRKWTHQETPLGRPSAAAYRTGCRCDECRELYKAYMRDWRRTSVAAVANDDGTTYYHSHKGQPSATTAIKWGCVHPRCLHLAKLHLDEEGVVRQDSDNAVAPIFGQPKPEPEPVS